MCDCGCNTCETKTPVMLNESVAPKEILSEGLKYHMDNNMPLTEHVYRAGSQKYFDLWAEARALYSRGILEVTGDDLEVLTETDLGNFGMFEGKKVPLDFPIELTEEEIQEIYNVYESKILKNGDKYLGYSASEQIYYVKDSKTGRKVKHTENAMAQLYGIDWKEQIDEAKNKNRIIVKTNGKRLVIDREDLQRLKSGKDVVGYSTKHAGQQEWILAKDKWEIEGPLNEAKKKKGPKLNKPMRSSSGGKAYKVYVRDPKTKKVKTVRFGSGGLKAKINNPKARQAFAKRHNCAQKKDKTKASYWSCRLPRYAKLLGLKSNFSGFW